MYPNFSGIRTGVDSNRHLLGSQFFRLPTQSQISLYVIESKGISLGILIQKIVDNLPVGYLSKAKKRPEWNGMPESNGDNRLLIPEADKLSLGKSLTACAPQNIWRILSS